MATCCEYRGTKPNAFETPANFWGGLALGLSIWMVLVGALVIA